MITEPYIDHPRIFNYRSYKENRTSFVLLPFKIIFIRNVRIKIILPSKEYSTPLQGLFQNSECWHLFKNQILKKCIT